MDKNDTCIIFGTSPYINILGSDNINKLINKYTTVGINAFPTFYNNIDYWIWSDYNLYQTFYKDLIKKDHKIITSSEVFKRELSGLNLNVEYVYEGSSEISFKKLDNKLMMFKTTAHPAINYMMLNNYKNIILCGIDLTENWNHFNSLGDMTRTSKRISQIRERLYGFKKYVNLYTLNPDSDLDIEKINIKDLI